MMYDSSKSMTLRQKQSLFARMVNRLLVYAESLGYEITFGDAARPDRVTCPKCTHRFNARGRVRSLHKVRLAIDLNLFLDGDYLPNTEDHRPLGEYWEMLGGSWGGRFNDGNHYSLAHNGRR